MMKVFLFSILLVLALQVHATTLVYKSFDDLVKDSDGIVTGTVTNIEARMDERGIIYTYVTLGDLRILYGRYKGKELTLRMEGGRVGGQGLDIEGSPRFQNKEKVILFVKGNGRNIVPFVGWSQGVFRVTKDPDSRQEVITDSHGNRVFGIQSGHIIKEQRFPSEAEIIGSPPPVNPYSRPLKGGAGVTEKGETVKSLDNKMGITAEKPINLEAFTKEIQKRARQKKIAPTPLVSMTTGAKIEVPEGVDARPQAVEEPAAIKQAPSTELVPGELPKRIDIEAEKREAEKKERGKKEGQKKQEQQ